MAYILANKDGTSNAKVGDVVVTGGGLYEKTATGSKYIGGLTSAVKKTSDYNELSKIYQDNYGGWIGSGSGSSGGTNPPTPQPDAAPETPTPAPEVEDVTFDANGIGYLNGFDMSYYPTYPTGSGSLKNFFGYILLGLIALVILERLVDK